MLHTKIEEPDYEPFSRRELTSKKDYSNVCGDADGCSITRCEGLTDDAIVEASIALAEIRPGRVGRGGLAAQVQKIRDVRLPDNDNQVCFVYDDPMPSNKMHAVIRIAEELDRTDVDAVRVRLRGQFDHRITPPDEPVMGAEEVIMKEGPFVAALPKYGP